MQVLCYLLLLSCVTALSALKLPGSCPSVLPTTPSLNVTEALSDAEILQLVPFAVHKSIMFYGNHSSFLPNISVHVKTPGSEPVLDKPKNHNFIFGTLEEGKDNQTESLHLQVHVLQSYADGYFNVLKFCQTRTEEEIRVWVEKEWIIIWSCANVLSSSEHDQAVMTSYGGVEDLQTLSSEEFQEKLQELKGIAKKYIPSTLIDVMDWSPMGKGSPERVPLISMKCPYED